jgi:tetrahydrodipicolinate N-succinyltransferase
MKLEGHYFDTIEVIEAELRAVLNTISRMRLKNGRSVRKRAYMRKGTTLRVMVACKPKVSF